MVRKSVGGDYPEDWTEIAKAVKEDAGWCCVRCGASHEPENGYCLTVHHLDMNPSNCAWWNIPALCQRCHLHIQHKVVMHQPWMFEHSSWFKPYVAGYYAYQHDLPDDRQTVVAYQDDLIALGQGSGVVRLSLALGAGGVEKRRKQ